MTIPHVGARGRVGIDSLRDPSRFWSSFVCPQALSSALIAGLLCSYFSIPDVVRLRLYNNLWRVRFVLHYSSLACEGNDDSTLCCVISRVTVSFQMDLRRALALLECTIPTGMSRGWYSCRQTTRIRGDCYDVNWRNGLKHIDDLAGFCQGNRQKHLSLCLERSRRGYTSGELLPAIRIVGVHVAMFVIIYRSS